MNIPNETFDLIREKQELDAFLSTFATVSPSPPMEEEREPDPVPSVVPFSLTYAKDDKPASAMKDRSSGGMPDTPVPAPSSLSQAEAAKDSSVEETAAAAPESELGRMPSPERDPGKQPESPLPVPDMPAPPPSSLSPVETVRDPFPEKVEAVAAEGEQDGSPSPEALKNSNEIPEMDRTLRIERRKIEEAASMNEQSPESVEDNGAKNGETTNVSVLPGSRKKNRRPLILSGLILCLVLALSALGYSWLRPSSGHGAVHWLSMNVPFAQKYLEVGQPHRNPAGVQVGIVNLQQRLIRNATLGRDIRVIEGTAFNRGHENISGIRVRGELYGSRDTLLAARMVYCGNVMTVDQLETMGEDELRLALSVSQANLQTTSVVPPGGQTPFMIVFVHEPAGTVQAMVEPVSMERVR